MTNIQYKNDELTKWMIDQNNATKQQQKYMMTNKRNIKKYNKNNENVFVTSLMLSLFMQCTTTTKSYDENVCSLLHFCYHCLWNTMAIVVVDS